MICGEEEDYRDYDYEREEALRAKYPGLNSEEIADLEEDEQNRKAYEEMMQASWSY